MKQLRQYELGTDTEPPSCLLRAPNQSRQATVMASAELADGDIEGVVQLLCSEERLAVSDDPMFAKLSRLHPEAPANRSPAP